MFSAVGPMGVASIMPLGFAGMGPVGVGGACSTAFGPVANVCQQTTPVTALIPRTAVMPIPSMVPPSVTQGAPILTNIPAGYPVATAAAPWGKMAAPWAKPGMTGKGAPWAKPGMTGKGAPWAKPGMAGKGASCTGKGTGPWKAGWESAGYAEDP